MVDVEKKIPPDVLVLISEEALNFLASRNGLIAQVFKITENEWLNLMKQYAGLGEEVGEALEGLRKELAEEKEKIPVSETRAQKEQAAPIIRMVATILKHGIESKASDVHIEPTMKKLRVRYRLDGALQTVVVLPVEITPAIVARIKILSNLQIDETRRPPDGRFS